MGDRIDNLTIDGKKLIKELKVLELKAELERRGLSKYGNKKELLQRLSIFEENRQKSLSGQPSCEAPNQWLENEADLNNDFLREYFRSQKALFQEHAQRRTEIGAGEAPSVPPRKEQSQRNDDEFILSNSHRESFSPPKITPSSPSKKKKRKKKTPSDDKQVTYTPLLYESSLATSRPSRSSAQASRALNVVSFVDEDSESPEIDPYVFDIKEKKKGHKKHHRIPTLKLHTPIADSISQPKSLLIFSSFSGEEKVPSLKIKLPEPVPKISTSIISPTKDSINCKLKIGRDESELSKATPISKKTSKVCLSPQNAEVSSSVEEIVTDSLVKSTLDSCNADSTSNEGNSSSDGENRISCADDKVISPELMDESSLKTHQKLNLKISPRRLCHLGNQQWHSENSVHKESPLLTPSTSNEVLCIESRKETESSICLNATASHVQSDGVKPTVRKRGRPRLKPVAGVSPPPKVYGGNLKPCISTPSPCKVISKNEPVIKKLDDKKLLNNQQQSIENQIKEDLINLRLRELDIKESLLKQKVVPSLPNIATLASIPPSISKKMDESIRRSSRLYKPSPAETVKKKNEFSSALLKPSKPVPTCKKATNKLFPNRTPTENLQKTGSNDQPDYFQSLKQQIEMPLYVEKFPSDKSEVSSSTSELSDTAKLIPKTADVSCNYQPFTRETPILDAHMAVEGHTTHASTVSPGNRNISSPLLVSSLPKLKPVKSNIEISGSSVVKKSGYMIENLIETINEKGLVRDLSPAVNTCKISPPREIGTSRTQSVISLDEKVPLEKIVATTNVRNQEESGVLHASKDSVPLKTCIQETDFEMNKQLCRMASKKHSVTGFSEGKTLEEKSNSLQMPVTSNLKKIKDSLEPSQQSSEDENESVDKCLILRNEICTALPKDNVKTDGYAELTNFNKISSVHQISDVKLNYDDKSAVSKPNNKTQERTLKKNAEQRNIVTDDNTSALVIKKLCDASLTTVSVVATKITEQVEEKIANDLNLDKDSNIRSASSNLIGISSKAPNETSASFDNNNLLSDGLKEHNETTISSKINLDLPFIDKASTCSPSISNLNAETPEIKKDDDSDAQLQPLSIVPSSVVFLDVETETQNDVPKVNKCCESKTINYKDILMEAALAADIESDDLGEGLCHTSEETELTMTKENNLHAYKSTLDASSLNQAHESPVSKENFVVDKGCDMRTDSNSDSETSLKHLNKETGFLGVKLTEITIGGKPSSQKHDFIEKFSANVYNAKKDSSKGLMEIIFDLDKRATCSLKEKQYLVVEELHKGNDLNDNSNDQVQPRFSPNSNIVGSKDDLALLSVDKVETVLKSKVCSESLENVQSISISKNSSELTNVEELLCVPLCNEDKFKLQAKIDSPIAMDSPAENTSVSEDEVNFFREVMESVPELEKKKPCFEPLLKLQVPDKFSSQDAFKEHSFSVIKDHLIEDRMEPTMSLDLSLESDYSHIGLSSELKSKFSEVCQDRKEISPNSLIDTPLEELTSSVEKPLTADEFELDSSGEYNGRELSENAESILLEVKHASEMKSKLKPIKISQIDNTTFNLTKIAKEALLYERKTVDIPSSTTSKVIVKKGSSYPTVKKTKTLSDKKGVQSNLGNLNTEKKLETVYSDNVKDCLLPVTSKTDIDVSSKSVMEHSDTSLVILDNKKASSPIICFSKQSPEISGSLSTTTSFNEKRSTPGKADLPIEKLEVLTLPTNEYELMCDDDPHLNAADDCISTESAMKNDLESISSNEKLSAITPMSELSLPIEKKSIIPHEKIENLSCSTIGDKQILPPDECCTNMSHNLECIKGIPELKGEIKLSDITTDSVDSQKNCDEKPIKTKGCMNSDLKYNDSVPVQNEQISICLAETDLMKSLNTDTLPASDICSPSTEVNKDELSLSFQLGSENSSAFERMADEVLHSGSTKMLCKVDSVMDSIFPTYTACATQNPALPNVQKISHMGDQCYDKSVSLVIAATEESSLSKEKLPQDYMESLLDISELSKNLELCSESNLDNDQHKISTKRLSYSQLSNDEPHFEELNESIKCGEQYITPCKGMEITLPNLKVYTAAIASVEEIVDVKNEIVCSQSDSISETPVKLNGDVPSVSLSTVAVCHSVPFESKFKIDTSCTSTQNDVEHSYIIPKLSNLAKIALESEKIKSIHRVASLGSSNENLKSFTSGCEKFNVQSYTLVDDNTSSTFDTSLKVATEKSEQSIIPSDEKNINLENMHKLQHDPVGTNILETIVIPHSSVESCTLQLEIEKTVEEKVTSATSITNLSVQEYQIEKKIVSMPFIDDYLCSLENKTKKCLFGPGSTSFTDNDFCREEKIVGFLKDNKVFDEHCCSNGLKSNSSIDVQHQQTKIGPNLDLPCSKQFCPTDKLELSSSALCEISKIGDINSEKNIPLDQSKLDDSLAHDDKNITIPYEMEKLSPNISKNDKQKVDNLSKISEEFHIPCLDAGKLELEIVPEIPVIESNVKPKSVGENAVDQQVISLRQFVDHDFAISICSDEQEQIIQQERPNELLLFDSSVDNDQMSFPSFQANPTKLALKAESLQKDEVKSLDSSQKVDLQTESNVALSIEQDNDKNAEYLHILNNQKLLIMKQVDQLQTPSTSLDQKILCVTSEKDEDTNLKGEKHFSEIPINNLTRQKIEIPFCKSFQNRNAMIRVNEKIKISKSVRSKSNSLVDTIGEKGATKLKDGIKACDEDTVEEKIACEIKLFRSKYVPKNTDKECSNRDYSNKYGKIKQLESSTTAITRKKSAHSEVLQEIACQFQDKSNLPKEGKLLEELEDCSTEEIKPIEHSLKACPEERNEFPVVFDLSSIPLPPVLSPDIENLSSPVVPIVKNDSLCDSNEGNFVATKMARKNKSDETVAAQREASNGNAKEEGHSPNRMATRQRSRSKSKEKDVVASAEVERRAVKLRRSSRGDKAAPENVDAKHENDKNGTNSIQCLESIHEINESSVKDDGQLSSETSELTKNKLIASIENPADIPMPDIANVPLPEPKISGIKIVDENQVANSNSQIVLPVPDCQESNTENQVPPLVPLGRQEEQAETETMKAVEVAVTTDSASDKKDRKPNTLISSKRSSTEESNTHSKRRGHSRSRSVSSSSSDRSASRRKSFKKSSRHSSSRRRSPSSSSRYHRKSSRYSRHSSHKGDGRSRSRSVENSSTRKRDERKDEKEKDDKKSKEETREKEDKKDKEERREKDEKISTDEIKDDKNNKEKELGDSKRTSSRVTDKSMDKSKEDKIEESTAKNSMEQKLKDRKSSSGDRNSRRDSRKREESSSKDSKRHSSRKESSRYKDSVQESSSKETTNNSCKSYESKTSEVPKSSKESSDSKNLDRSLSEDNETEKEAITDVPLAEADDLKDEPAVIFKSARIVSIHRSKSTGEDEQDKPKKRKWGTSVASKPTLEISSNSLKTLMPDVKPLSPSELTLKYSSDSSEDEPDAEVEFNLKDTDHNDLMTDLMSDDEEKYFEKTIVGKQEEDHSKVEDEAQPEFSPSKRKKSISTDTRKKEKHDKRESRKDRIVKEISPRRHKRHSPEKSERALIVRKISVLEAGPYTYKPSIAPAQNPVSRVIVIMNLTRPFTVKAITDLLLRTGRLAENGFWMDRIKSTCLAMYETEDQAEETRAALHGVKWPADNNKNLFVDFATEKDLKEKLADRDNALPTYSAEEPRRERRKLEGPIREWDLAKVGERSPGEREREKEKQRREREEERERDKRRREQSPKEERKPKKPPPIKSVDDLFRKTNARPFIYWLPLTPEQIVEKEAHRREKMAKSERMHAEINEQKRLRQKRREKEREKEKAEREKEKELREKEREQREKERNVKRTRSRSRRRSRSRSQRKSPRRSPRRSRRSASRDSRKSHRRSRSRSRS